MTSSKIVVTDYEFPDLAPELEVVRCAGFDLHACQCKTEDELIDACHDAVGIINQYAQINARVIGALQACKVISRYGIGLNTIDVTAATEKGIYIGNVPDGSLEEVSDHAIAMMLSLARGLPGFDHAMREDRWNYAAAKPLFRIRGRTLGLLGFGQIPQRVASKMAAFGVRVMAHDPFADQERAHALGVSLVEMETLCRESDFLSVHVPLNESTHHILGSAQFALMKPTALVINTARGPVVDEQALVAALQERRIAGAGLDVFEQEPLASGHPLKSMRNVVLSPHAAWYSEGSEIEIRSKAARNVVDVLQGRRPTYLANPDVLTVLSARPA